MSFKNGGIATVWSLDGVMVDDRTSFAYIYCTTSKKNKATGGYKTNFKAKVKFIQNAYKKIKEMNLTDRSKIILTEVSVEMNEYNGKWYTEYLCWDCELGDYETNDTPKSPNIIGKPITDDTPPDLPF